MTDPDLPILIGLSGATFLIPAESGGYVMSFVRKTVRDVVKVYDASVGKWVGKVFHNPRATWTMTLITTATTGVPAAAPGVVLTVANTISGNGVTAGGIYPENTTISHSSEQLQTFEFEAEQCPAIS